ncbi:MAG TPA: hypothetical protein VI248_13455 [Kineosporiaceae bacterium]
MIVALPMAGPLTPQGRLEICRTKPRKVKVEFRVVLSAQGGAVLAAATCETSPPWPLTSADALTAPW